MKSTFLPRTLEKRLLSDSSTTIATDFMIKKNLGPFSIEREKVIWTTYSLSCAKRSLSSGFELLHPKNFHENNPVRVWHLVSLSETSHCLHSYSLQTRGVLELRRIVSLHFETVRPFHPIFASLTLTGVLRWMEKACFSQTCKRESKLSNNRMGKDFVHAEKPNQTDSKSNRQIMA